MPRPSLVLKFSIILGALLIPLAYYVNYWVTLHDNLAHQISHQAELGDKSILLRYDTDLETLPQDVVRSNLNYVVLHDEAVRVVKSSTLPQWDERQMLTTYLRHNMELYTKLPQAWILWLLADSSSKQTFQQDYISKLDFKEGDRVCGTYVVQRRRPNRAEMVMSLGEPGSKEFIEARLVIGVSINERREEVTFRTQTLMWRRQDSGTLMPLERSLPKWLHELASWSLISRGIKHLVQLRQDGTI